MRTIKRLWRRRFAKNFSGLEAFITAICTVFLGLMFARMMGWY